jgi:hypothetical protein
MESLDYQKIREYCQAALEIADEVDLHEGLSFLIGEKFCALLSEVKKAETHLKYLYNEDDQENLGDLLKGERSTMRESYSQALQTTYRRSLRKFENLRRLRNDFAEEIKEAFDLPDIQEFLDSYPRLGPTLHTNIWPEDALLEEKEGSLNFDDVLSEVDDIFMVEELRKFFSDKTSQA